VPPGIAAISRSWSDREARIVHAILASLLVIGQIREHEATSFIRSRVRDFSNGGMILRSYCGKRLEHAWCFHLSLRPIVVTSSSEPGRAQEPKHDGYRLQAPTNENRTRFFGKAELTGQRKEAFERRLTKIDDLAGIVFGHQSVKQRHLSFEVVDTSINACPEL
jgi:hypothetical protein